MTDDDVTPIRQQYLDIKKQYPDSILFFRLGDFYETFDQDAETTSKILDIVLTSRNVAKGMRVPMAGIPFHAVESYLSRLISAGYHVAICEQVGTQPASGIFPRQVVKVITPGTIIEAGLLQNDRNNYLVCLYWADDVAGVCYADITTGEFAATELTGSDIQAIIRAELSRLNPAELLHPENQAIPDGIATHISRLPIWRFEQNRCQDAILEHFKVAALDGFGIRGHPQAIRAAGALLQYLGDTRRSALDLLTSLHMYSTSDFMVLDGNTRRNLELNETIRKGEVHGSLLDVLDQTCTPMGKRLIRQWINKPLLDEAAINNRLDFVDFFFKDGILRGGLREQLASISDLERLISRSISGNALPRDLVSMRSTFSRLPQILQLITQTSNPPSDFLSRFSTCGQDFQLLQNALAEEPPATLQNIGIIRPGYSSELDQVIETSRHAREWIANLENKERENTGIKNLKVGYNKVFGYYIEITNSNTGNAPVHYIRKQTLVNAERYITPEMKEYETLVLNAEDRIRELEIRLFREICGQISSNAKNIQNTAQVLAEWDVFASLAEVAAVNNYVRPVLEVGTTLDIRNGRHPVVEHSLLGSRYVPNDITYEVGEIVRIITGPNMSGKSTFLRQAALIVLMAQMGSFVPASSAKIGLVDRIFTRIGAQDEIHAGQSTFMVEMTETANILHHATTRSLLIMDEIGRGTSTYDGVSIAWAMIEFIHNHPNLRSRTLFATHYHELTQLSDLLPGVRNYNVAVTESDDKVVFLHKIVPGGADRSYGIHVAQLAGIPIPIIQRSSEILKHLELSSGRAVSVYPVTAQQLALFPATNPLVAELKNMDLNVMSPIEALSRLYEWQKKYTG